MLPRHWVARHALDVITCKTYTSYKFISLRFHWTSDSFSQRAPTVCGAVGFEQAETVVGTLRTISEAFQHAEIGNVEGGGQQVAHLTHKLGQNNLFYTKQSSLVPLQQFVFFFKNSCSGHIRAGQYLSFKSLLTSQGNYSTNVV